MTWGVQVLAGWIVAGSLVFVGSIVGIWCCPGSRTVRYEIPGLGLMSALDWDASQACT